MASANDDDSISPIDSLVAYQILQELGISKAANEFNTHVKKDLGTTLNNLVSSIMMNSRLAITGSGADGSASIYALTGLRTDIDFMDIKDYCIALSSIDDIRENSPHCQLLVVSDDPDNPAFVKLLLVAFGLNPQGIFLGLAPSILQEQDGRHYLSSSELKIFTKNSFLRFALLNVISISHTFESILLQGPASTCNFTNLTLGFQNGFSLGNIDLVFAIPCLHWPEVASEWVNRARKSNWPSKSTVTEITSRGCFMVPKSSTIGRNKNLQWAYSFAHVEPILIGTMNDVMVKTYIMLKLLNIIIFKTVEECRILSSYVLKTSLLWEVENSQSDEWLPDQLLTCVRRCLRRLRTWIDRGFVPHYFISNQNLITSRLEPRVKEKVLECLTDAIETFDFTFKMIPPFLVSLQSRSVSEILEAYYDNAGNIDAPENKDIMDKLIQRTLLFTNIVSVPFIIGTHASRYAFLNPEWIVSFRRKIIHLFSADTNSDSRLLPLSILLAKLLSLEIFRAKEQASGRHRTNKDTYREYRLSICIRSLNRLRVFPFLPFSNLVHQLIQYSFPFNRSAFEHCIREIEVYKEANEILKVNYTDNSNLFPTFLNYITRNATDILSEATSGVNTRPLFVDDIHLTELELKYLPPPLSLEVYCRLDTELEQQAALRIPNELVLSLDSEALFYFLSFCFYHTMDRNISKYQFLKKLEYLCHQSNTLHVHLAWNMYGHCLLCMGQYQDSLMAYYKCIVACDKNVDVRKLSKATPLHVAILLNKYLQSRRT